MNLEKNNKKDEENTEDTDNKESISDTSVSKSTKREPQEKKKVKSKRKKSKKKKETLIVEHPLDQFGLVRKCFIIEHLRDIYYVDIAKMLGIHHDELKTAVEKMGIKLPIDRARKWADIDVGKFSSLTFCARCQVQNNHASFYVGINNCRKCYDKNIKNWIDKNIPITLIF